MKYLEFNLDKDTGYIIDDNANIKYDKKTRQMYWDIAIGLNDVDGLKPSKYFRDLVLENIEGNINNRKIELALKQHYEEKGKTQESNMKEQECDFVSLRIKESLEDISFSFRPIALKGIHRELFNDIDKYAGVYRDYNIFETEHILNGESVNYIKFRDIENALRDEFEVESEIKYLELSRNEQIERIATFTSRIWQIHPFGEGNTRTTAVFIQKYLKNKGFEVSNDIFIENSFYFRNALVRANYENNGKQVKKDDQYLIMFFENLLNGTTHELKNINLIAKKMFDK